MYPASLLAPSPPQKDKGVGFVRVGGWVGRYTYFRFYSHKIPTVTPIWDENKFIKLAICIKVTNNTWELYPCSKFINMMQHRPELHLFRKQKTLLQINKHGAFRELERKEK